MCFFYKSSINHFTLLNQISLKLKIIYFCFRLIFIVKLKLDQNVNILTKEGKLGSRSFTSHIFSDLNKQKTFIED